MRLPKRGERGFTLIELLIVVAILGVLAAVIIPNLQRFIGAGETEAQETELATIQLAVTAMMVDNVLPELPPGSFPALSEETATNQMGDDPATTAIVEIGFPAPNATTADGGLGAKDYDPDGEAYNASDGNGYILFGHDITGGDGVPPTLNAAALVNYVARPSTAYWYWVEATGTVHQVTTAP